MGFTGRDVHINQPLSNVAMAYRPEGFIADQLFPVVPVQKQSDGYYIWNIADAFRIEDDLRAPGTKPNVVDFTVSSGTYFCVNRALAAKIPYEDIANADAGFVFTERSARAQYVVDKLSLAWEYRAALKMTSGSNCGSYSAISSGWGGSGADPVEDVMFSLDWVQDNTGRRPNSLVFGGYAWRKFITNAAVLNKFYGTAGASSTGRIVTQQMVKDLFEVERLLIGGAYRTTTEEGATAASLANIWNDNVLAYYAPMSPRKDVPSYGYSFRWNAVPGMNMVAEVFQDNEAKVEKVQVGYYQDEKITGQSLSFLLTGVGSSQ